MEQTPFPISFEPNFEVVKKNAVLHKRHHKSTNDTCTQSKYTFTAPHSRALLYSTVAMYGKQKISLNFPLNTSLKLKRCRCDAVHHHDHHHVNHDLDQKTSLHMQCDCLYTRPHTQNKQRKSTNHESNHDHDLDLASVRARASVCVRRLL